MADPRRVIRMLGLLALALACAACASEPERRQAWDDDEAAPPPSVLSQVGTTVGQGLTTVGDYTVKPVADLFKPAPPLQADRIEIVRGTPPATSAPASAAPAGCSCCQIGCAPSAAPAPAAATGPALPLPPAATAPAKPAAVVAAPAPKLQRLTVDLTTGRAAFTDFSGKVYPQQLDERVLAQLRELVASREWLVGMVGPGKNAPPAKWCYQMHASQAGKPVKKARAGWCLPTTESLPDALAQVVSLFERANRVAHPLSEKVNLLQ